MPPTYEQHIRDTAAKLNAEVSRVKNGLLVTREDEDGHVWECWHKLKGHAEERFNRRHEAGGVFLEPGRWIKNDDGIEAWAAPGDNHAGATLP